MSQQRAASGRRGAAVGRGGGAGAATAHSNRTEITAFLFRKKFTYMSITSNKLMQELEHCSELLVRLFVLNFSSKSRKRVYWFELVFVHFVQFDVLIFTNQHRLFCTIF
jgi:hypothetical protein